MGWAILSGWRRGQYTQNRWTDEAGSSGQPMSRAVLDWECHRERGLAAQREAAEAFKVESAERWARAQALHPHRQ